MCRTRLLRTASGTGVASMLVNVILLALTATMAQAAYAADRMSAKSAGGGPADATTTVSAVSRSNMPVATRAGGRITFTGAVVVGTAATPVATVAPSRPGATLTLRGGRYATPARQVTVWPLQPRELSPEIERLELPGEDFGSVREAVVTYQ